LNELQEKWAIAEPAFSYDSLKFSLDFEISDFISSVNQVRSTLFVQDCESSYIGSSLSDTVGSVFTSIDGDGKQNITVEIDIDSSTVAGDGQVFSEQADLGTNGTANVDFCVRVGLHTPSDNPSDADEEINYLEVIIRLEIDLTDGFEVQAVNVEARDKCAIEAEEAFLVEGYFCEEGQESDAEFVQASPITQGQRVKICVRPDQRGLDNFVRMRRIVNFSFKRDDPPLEQQAVVNYGAAPTGLTELYCTNGYAICHFETILFASFFTSSGNITGSGVADLQFGGEESITSVSPRAAAPFAGRRTLREAVRGLPFAGRRTLREAVRGLQADDIAGTTAFDLDLEVVQSTSLLSDGSSSSPPSCIREWATLSFVLVISLSCLFL
jgi:hypothetical protein